MALMDMASSPLSFGRMLLTSPREGFPPNGIVMETPEGIQLLLISMLLVAFGMAIHIDDSTKQEKSRAELVRPHVIALRLAAAAGIAGLAKLAPAGPHPEFPPSGTSLEVPEGIQLLLLCPLFLVFAAAVQTADENPGKSDTKSEEQSQQSQRTPVQLVRAHAIAFRFAVAGGVLGLVSLLKAMPMPASPREGFPPAGASLEVMELTQLLLLAPLLLVFAAAVRSDEDCSEEDQAESKVQLVRADAIALRFAVAAGAIGLRQAMGSTARVMAVSAWVQASAMLPVSPREGFPTAGATLEASDGVQLLLISALLLVFTLAIRTDDEDSQEGPAQNEGQPPVQLVKADAIAFRLAAASGTAGFLKMVGAAVPAASMELAMKGGLLLVGTGLVLSDARLNPFHPGAGKKID